MDLLRSYGEDASSGDSCTEEGDQTGDNDTNEISEFQNASRSQYETNFFHLGSDCDEIGKSSQEENLGEDRTVLLDVSGDSQVEVPESPFWRKFSTEDLKQARERGNKTMIPHALTPKSCRGVVHHHAKSRTFKSMDRNHDENTTCEHGENTSEHGEPNSKVMKYSGSTSTRTLASRSQTADLQRNIFYFHSRIKPGVHFQHRNQPAKTEERDLGACHGGVVNRVKWNTASFSHLFLSASMDSSVCVWNAWSDGDPCVRKLKHHGKAVKDAEWSGDGRTILSCSYDRTAVLSDVETGTRLCRLEHASYVTCGKFNPVRSSQVVTGSTNCLQQWDLRTPHTACRDFCHKDHMGQIQDVLFSRDGNQMFTCSDMVTRDSADRNIMAWDYGSGVILSNQIYQERYACVRLKLHPSSSNFLAQTHGSYIALFSTSRPYKMVRSRRFQGHSVGNTSSFDLQGYGIGFDISRDGSLVYSGSSDSNIQCYDFQTGKLRHTVETGQDVCMDVSCHPVLPSTLLSCSWDGNIKVFH